MEGDRTMKEKFAEEVLPILMEQLERGWNFLEGEIPILVQEILEYNLYQSWTLFWISATLFLIGVVLVLLEISVDGAVGLLGIFTLVPAGIIAVIEVFDIIKIKTAPRLFILEWAKDFV